MRLRELVNCARNAFCNIAYGEDVPEDCVKYGWSEWDVMRRGYNHPGEAKREALRLARLKIGDRPELSHSAEALEDEVFLHFVFSGEESSDTRFYGNIESHLLYERCEVFVEMINLYAAASERAYLLRCLDIVMGLRSLPERAAALRQRIVDREGAIVAEETRLLHIRADASHEA